MPPILLHIYGPIAIHSFGLMIALSLIITLRLLSCDKQLNKLISYHLLTTIFQISFFAGIAGGRIWFLLTNLSTVNSWTDCLTVWSGGLSILGCIIGIILTLSMYFYYAQLPALKILDRIAIYAPLTYAISRLGCFFAGCCFGQQTNVSWGVMYTNVDSLAPLYLHLHPTQLYSSFFLGCSFLALLAFDRYYPHKKPGQLIALFIILISVDRFFIDFLRGDREFFTQPGLLNYFSIQQMLALFLCAGAVATLLFITINKQPNESI